jgi:hypothetical protein
MIDNGDFQSFVLRVLTSYYDKLYLHSQERRANRKVVLEASNLEPSELESLARTIIAKEVNTE